jgi:hypothetical protein
MARNQVRETAPCWNKESKSETAKPNVKPRFVLVVRWVVSVCTMQELKN